MKTFILVYLFFFEVVINCNGQLPIFANCATDTTSSQQVKNSKVEIYIVSDPGCGFCRRAFKDIGNWSMGKAVSVIALDVSGNAAATQQNSLYQKYAIKVIDASQCSEKLKKFIPKIYIFETKSNKGIMRLRGWNSKGLAKLEKKLNKYLNI